jgi:hypothetical protein
MNIVATVMNFGRSVEFRSSVNAFDDARVARAIEATGRKKSFHLFKSV